MKQFVIPEDLANAILNYLGSRPYVEVAPIIEKLARLPELTKEASPDGD